jgi:hypothetical protein
MSEPSPLAAAHQAIGAFFCAFSRVDHQVGESVKTVYGLQDNDASEAIVAALGDVARKASLVWAASKGAKDANGSDASAEWKDKVEATIKRVFDCNTQDRVPLSHSLLRPNADGSVNLVRLKIEAGEVRGKDGIKWSQDQFKQKTRQLDKLADDLAALNGELRTFRYSIPDTPSSYYFDGMMSPRGIPAALRFAMLNQPPTADSGE